MGRFGGSNSYGFSCRKYGEDWYRLSWVVDSYYSNSRLRHPKRFTRDTDLAGAKRFCKKHDLKIEFIPTAY